MRVARSIASKNLGKSNLDPYSFLVMRYHRVADEFFLQDFFEKEHRAEVEQNSFVTFTNIDVVNNVTVLSTSEGASETFTVTDKPVVETIGLSMIVTPVISSSSLGA